MLKRLFTFGFLVVASALIAASPASASLVSYGTATVGVTAVQVLTFNPAAHAGTVSGCAYWDGSATQTGGCVAGAGGGVPPYWPITLANIGLDTTGNSTTTPLALGAANTRSIGILLLPDEPASAGQMSVSVSKLVLAIQNPSNGSVVYSAVLSSPYLIADAHAPTAAWVFSFDGDQSVAAQQAIIDAGLAFSTVRLSVGAELTDVDGGGGEIFYLQNIPDLVPVPEPATFALIGAGLIGVGLLRRRHHRQ